MTEQADFATDDERVVALRSDLEKQYRDIKERARAAILTGSIVDNPRLVAKKDPGFALAVDGFIHGPADHFLRQATDRVRHIEPTARYVSDGFRHVTLREVVYDPKSRRALQIGSREIQAYYATLKSLSHYDEPIRLELLGIFPAIDSFQPSVSLIAGFVPLNEKIMQVREDIPRFVKEAGLPLSSRLGDTNSCHVTLARFPHPPRREGDEVPLLDLLDRVNQEIPIGIEAVIDEVELISTSHVSYFWLDKHIFISPPIAPTREKQQEEPFRILRPHQRLARLQSA